MFRRGGGNFYYFNNILVSLYTFVKVDERVISLSNWSNYGVCVYSSYICSILRMKTITKLLKINRKARARVIMEIRSRCCGLYVLTMSFTQI